MSPRILIAGIGNIFLGDDAFGVEVIKELAGRQFPANVRVVDFGIRGLDLTYALLEDYDLAILVDAVPCGKSPGTLYVLEPDAPAPAPSDPGAPPELLIETHGMHPAKVLRLVAAMGGALRRVLIVGCEPAPFDPETDMEICLSPAVRAALPQAIKLIESLVAKALAGDETAEYQPKGASAHVAHDPDLVGSNAPR